MDNYKVKMVVLDDQDRVRSSVFINSEILEDMNEYHGLSALDENLKIMLSNIEEEEKGQNNEGV